MKNDKSDLNIFELLSGDTQKKPEKEKNDQGQSAPDPFFHEAIKQAIDRNSETVPRTGRQVAVLRGRRLWNWIRQGWRGFAVETAAVLLAVFVLFHAVFQVSLVSGDSMKPAICDGDRIILFRLDRSFERGDVIVFRTKDGQTRVKRVVAVAGDTVDISARGELLVNGEVVEEDYVYSSTTVTDETVTYPVTVDESSFFVLGDNRAESQDSRNQEIGLVEKEAILGRVVLSVRSF